MFADRKTSDRKTRPVSRRQKRRVQVSAFCVFFVLLTLFSVLTACNREQNTPPAGNPEQMEAEVYANHYGVSIEEAQARLSHGDSIRALQAAIVDGGESDTFGGLWLQNEPEYKIVVAFTRDGETTIKKYRQAIGSDIAPFIEVREVDYSLAQLERDQETMISNLRAAKIPCDSYVYVVENNVIVHVLDKDRARFDRSLANGLFALPDSVEVAFVEGLIQAQ